MKIFEIEINKINYSAILEKIVESIKNKKRLLITYVTADCLNKVYSNKILINYYSKFNIVHPDGVGVYWATKFLYGKDGLKERITGSDFYPVLANEICKNKWKVFFFGDTKKTNEKLKTTKITNCLVGSSSGYNFNNEKIIQKINESNADILFVGLGAPKQEKWILQNYSNLNTTVIITVGEGIKIFAKIRKRGPKIFRLIGLEWFIRLLYNPQKFWKRYLIGIPVFIYRVILFKIKNEN